MTEYKHRWSGWPGAYCLKCGVEDLLEIAIGNDFYDPYTDRWKSDELRRKYINKPCPVSDEEYDAFTEKQCKEHKEGV